MRPEVPRDKASGKAPSEATTRFGVVIGDPVEHSMSPALHNAAFEALGINASFHRQRVIPTELSEAIRDLADRQALGASVTVPHKNAIVSLCDDVTAEAMSIGAVNCLGFAPNGQITGHNTDGRGFVASLAESFTQPVAEYAPIILGGGGAARAIAHGLSSAGAKPSAIIARSPERVGWTRATPWTKDALASLLPSCNLIVDCTSTGLSADAESKIPCPIDIEATPANCVVASLIYHRETALLGSAKGFGRPVIDGMGMLIHQALLALRIWLGTAPEASVLWRAVGRGSGPGSSPGSSQSPPTAR